MDKRAEREARKRLKGKVWTSVLKVHRRPMRQRRSEVTEEIPTGSIPAPENVDGWDPNWGHRPNRGVRAHDPDLEWQEHDYEWSPHITEQTRAQIAGRQRQAAFQRDVRDERQRAEDAARAEEQALRRERRQVWTDWVLGEVRLTRKQRAVLTGDVVPSTRQARAQVLGRIDARVREQLQKR
jgi:hypothetical protein